MPQIKTKGDGRVETVNYTLDHTPSAWSEIGSEEMQALESPSGYERVVYHKPESEEPEGGWDDETESLGAVYKEIEEDDEG